jgi:hypothetical protein
MGSTDYTSDLDFTYISLKYPKKVLEMMVSFYNKFYTLFNNFPDVTFDTNFYICSTYIGKKCFETNTLEYLKPLFVQQGEYYRLYYTNKTTKKDKDLEVARQPSLDSKDLVAARQPSEPLDSKDHKHELKCTDFEKYYKQDTNFENMDREMCFLIQSNNISTMHETHNNTKLITLMNSAKLFYNILDNKDHFYVKDKLLPDINILILLLRTLYFVMASSSNESYTSDATYNIIVLGKQMDNYNDKCLSYVDNYMFIYEWFLFYKNRQNDIIEYFDVVCKYIVRCYDSLLHNNELITIGEKIEIDKKLVDDALYWRKNVRGKIPLKDVMKDDFGNKEIQDIEHRYKEINDIKKRDEEIRNVKQRNEKIQNIKLSLSKKNTSYIFDKFKNIYEKIQKYFVISQPVREIQECIMKMINNEHAKIKENKLVI